MGIAHDRRARHRRRRSARRLRLAGKPCRRADHAAVALPLQHLQRLERDGLRRSEWRCSERSSSSRSISNSSTARAPPSSGLRMLPLMLGLLVASIASGRAISRIGRYRIFPIAGTATLVAGMFLLSRLGAGTPPWLASVYMAHRRRRHRARDAGARAGRAERRRPREHRRRHLDRHLLPLGRRLVRRRDLRHHLRVAARPRSSRAFRPSVVAHARRGRPPQPRRGPAPAPGRSRRLPAGVRARPPRRLPLGRGDSPSSPSPSPGS